MKSEAVSWLEMEAAYGVSSLSRFVMLNKSLALLTNRMLATFMLVNPFL